MQFSGMGTKGAPLTILFFLFVWRVTWGQLSRSRGFYSNYGTSEAPCGPRVQSYQGFTSPYQSQAGRSRAAFSQGFNPYHAAMMDIDIPYGMMAGYGAFRAPLASGVASQSYYQQPATLNRRAQTAVYHRPQPATYTRRSQPTTYNRRAQSTTYNRRAQPTTYNRRAQPTTYNRRAQSVTYNRAAKPASYNRAAKPASYNRAAQTATYNRAAQTAAYNRASQTAAYNRRSQPLAYSRQYGTVAGSAATYPQARAVAQSYRASVGRRRVKRRAMLNFMNCQCDSAADCQMFSVYQQTGMTSQCARRMGLVCCCRA